MTDTDMLHMAALEAKLTEAEQLLRLSHDALRHATFPECIYAKADELKREIRNFLGE